MSRRSRGYHDISKEGQGEQLEKDEEPWDDDPWSTSMFDEPESLESSGPTPEEIARSDGGKLLVVPLSTLPVSTLAFLVKNDIPMYISCPGEKVEVTRASDTHTFVDIEDNVVSEASQTTANLSATRETTSEKSVNHPHPELPASQPSPLEPSGVDAPHTLQLNDILAKLEFMRNLADRSCSKTTEYRSGTSLQKSDIRIQWLAENVTLEGLKVEELEKLAVVGKRTSIVRLLDMARKVKALQLSRGIVGASELNPGGSPLGSPGIRTGDIIRFEDVPASAPGSPYLRVPQKLEQLNSEAHEACRRSNGVEFPALSTLRQRGMRTRWLAENTKMEEIDEALEELNMTRQARNFTVMRRIAEKALALQLEREVVAQSMPEEKESQNTPTKLDTGFSAGRILHPIKPTVTENQPPRVPIVPVVQLLIRKLERMDVRIEQLEAFRQKVGSTMVHDGETLGESMAQLPNISVKTDQAKITYTDQATSDPLKGWTITRAVQRGQPVPPSTSIQDTATVQDARLLARSQKPDNMSRSLPATMPLASGNSSFGHRERRPSETKVGAMIERNKLGSKRQRSIRRRKLRIRVARNPSLPADWTKSQSKQAAILNRDYRNELRVSHTQSQVMAKRTTHDWRTTKIYDQWKEEKVKWHPTVVEDLKTSGFIDNSAHTRPIDVASLHTQTINHAASEFRCVEASHSNTTLYFFPSQTLSPLAPCENSPAQMEIVLYESPPPTFTSRAHTLQLTPSGVISKSFETESQSEPRR